MNKTEAAALSKGSNLHMLLTPERHNLTANECSCNSKPPAEKRVAFPALQV